MPTQPTPAEVAVATFDCPQCKAARGTRCTSTSGAVVAPHARRFGRGEGWLSRDAQQPAPAPAPTPTPTPAPAPEPTPNLGRWVDAHYMPNMPIGIDSTPTADPTQTYWWRNYIDPLGEGGKHATYGGFTRDMPAGPYATTGDWKTTNYATEITQAKNGGIDGFLVNLMSTSGQNWDRAALLTKTAAADTDGFRVTPNLDCSRAAAIDEQDPVALAGRLAELYALGAARKVDGKPLLSSFTAETCTLDWWKRLRAALETKIGSIHLAIGLQNADTNMSVYAPVADTFGHWGPPKAAGAAGGTDYAGKAHALGKRWMQPVRPQDVRHYTSTYGEPENTTLLRTLWGKAIDQRADCVQVITWNDYAESSQVAPSRNNRGLWGVLNAYHAAWFKTGTPPKVTRDRIVLTHRVQAAATAGSMAGLTPMRPTLGGTNTPRDTAEALLFATAAGVVELRSGDAVARLDVPAGITTLTVPLRPGVVSATLTRSGGTVASVKSPDRVVTAPTVQDLTYHGAVSA